MKIILIPTLILLLSGCVSVPIQRKFPEIPPILLEPCKDLKEHPPSEKLSEQLAVVTENYGEYHKCKAKKDGLVDWYKEQKKISEEVNK